ncbi:Cys/Met metabolism PLP-dependent enzyme-domain-containing protein [Rhodofomes roseus]|uniref:Cys/Met metabolism PLP-dependent enzyme-domain-containing protein n=1 Tax=Rhodofomes roseus TaxID=34475 RepID=A0ABQ8JYF0_9APHY|nr:Cys/Met metabolism PLP-dependent enzyme-domain-containing protein [Rhodofomes roseus]KAH9829291.1 Cys/Met metabolism PLP-dependent enzyme-domain-containing protein [Rhodofomes roseus]
MLFCPSPIFSSIHEFDVILIDLSSSSSFMGRPARAAHTHAPRDIKYYASKAHAVGAKMLVDSTFAPPPLQYPFKWGEDMVMHSGTKYFGGHSDLLCGVLVVPTEAEWKTLWTQRTSLGSMMGSLELWLLLRSLGTLHFRVPRQSENAKGLARWLSQAAGGRAFKWIRARVIDAVWHSTCDKSRMILERPLDWSVSAAASKTLSFAAALIGMILIFLDTVKAPGLAPICAKIRRYGTGALWCGAWATAAATFVGHYQWFGTYNWLDEVLPPPDYDPGDGLEMGGCQTTGSHAITGMP